MGSSCAAGAALQVAVVTSDSDSLLQLRSDSDPTPCSSAGSGSGSGCASCDASSIFVKLSFALTFTFDQHQQRCPMLVPVPGALCSVLATSRELLHVADSCRCQEPLTVRFAALTWPDKKLKQAKTGATSIFQSLWQFRGDTLTSCLPLPSSPSPDLCQKAAA